MITTSGRKNGNVIIERGQQRPSRAVDHRPDRPAFLAMPPPPAAKSATLRDVARVAGVSPITASRALSHPEVVSDEAIARVQQAVEATGYIPNLLAGA
jgi:hypothetical protein